MLNQQQQSQIPPQQYTLSSTVNSDRNNLFDWYMAVLKNYAVFTGRARRKEYWYFTLVSMMAGIILAVVGVVAGIGSSLYYIYSLAVCIPSIAVAIRRMHDTNKSGWWLLFPVVNFVFLVQDGQREINQFGISPKSA
jgi:uncharacterized membrane protein YhaH (DUF805 family)